MKSQNFSGRAKIFHLAIILLCVCATTTLIVMRTPKKAPIPVEAPEAVITDTPQRDDEISNTSENESETRGSDSYQ